MISKKNLQGRLTDNGNLSDTLQNVKLKVYDSSFCSAYDIFMMTQNWQSQICSGIFI